MGAWGPGLYQNDISEDVRDYFKDQLHREKNAEQITGELLEMYSKERSDPGDAANFWFALADTQWEFGRLLPYVKEEALSILSQGGDLYQWQSSGTKNYAKRKLVLEKLYTKLNTPQPPEKKIVAYRLYQCPWNAGDVFSLQLDCEEAGKAGISGRHLLIEAVDTREWHPGHKIPIVYVKITEGYEVPSGMDEYNSLPYIISRTERIDFSIFPDEAITGRLAKLKSLADENGCLKEYRVAIVTTSERMVPKRMVYLGNFAGAEHPEREYISQSEFNYRTVDWKNIEEEFVRLYCRQLL